MRLSEEVHTQLFAIGRNKQPGQIIGSPPKATGKGPTYLLYGRLGKCRADRWISPEAIMGGSWPTTRNGLSDDFAGKKPYSVGGCTWMMEIQK